MAKIQLPVFFLNEITALSDGCLAIEAAFKSGSVITASQATDRIVPAMAIQAPLLTAALEDTTSLSQTRLISFSLSQKLSQFYHRL